jgi:hypothetical protein
MNLSKEVMILKKPCVGTGKFSNPYPNVMIIQIKRRGRYDKTGF